MSYEIEEGPTGAASQERLVERRLKLEADLKEGKSLARGTGGIGLAGAQIARAGEILLRRLGLFERARAEAEKLVITEQQHRLRRLPEEFDGMRVLHLTDLHCAANRAVVSQLLNLMTELDYDAVVMTGDYQDNIRFAEDDLIRGDMGALLRASKAPVFFTLGNHDHLAVAEILRAKGGIDLVNQFVRLRRKGAVINLAGVDDPHYYRCSNMDMVKKITDQNFTLLLAHSPEVHHSPKLSQTDLVLCGHTHGGQICLPGGFPVVTNSRCPRWSVKGHWKLGCTRGYTSRGVGTSGLQARLNCPPEVALHTLRRDG